MSKTGGRTSMSKSTSLLHSSERSEAGFQQSSDVSYGTMGNNDDAERPSAQRQISLLNDPELEGLSLYEKKAYLVNKELDNLGMGKYQWYIFFLCGFGYFLDLLWAQAFGLIVPAIQQEFGFSEAQYGDVFSAFSGGLTAGAFVWGFLVDIIGRYWAFNFTVLWSSIFGLVLGAPDTYTGIIVLAAFIGLGIGGNVPIDTTITLECLPTNRRWLLPALSLFQPIGVVVCSLLCYAFIPNYSCVVDLPSCKNVEAGVACCAKADNWGWRYVMFTLGALTLAIFIARYGLFSFQESPKYLLYRGKDDKAVKSLQYIAKFNGKKSKVTIETFSVLTDDSASISTTSSHNGSNAIMLGSGSKQKEGTFKDKANLELQRYKMFFATWGMIRLTVLLWLIYAFDYWGFTIAGSFLPRILKAKGQELGLSLAETYQSYVYIYLFGIPGVLAGALIYGWRRVSMVFSSALFAATLFIFTVVHSKASYIGINGLVYFFQSMFNAILYGITPEFFPAPIRGTASGVASFWGRLFSIIAPLAAAQVLARSLNGVLYLAGGSVFICTFLILLLPGAHLTSQNY